MHTMQTRLYINLQHLQKPNPKLLHKLLTMLRFNKLSNMQTRLHPPNKQHRHVLHNIMSNIILLFPNIIMPTVPAIMFNMYIIYKLLNMQKWVNIVYGAVYY